MLVLAVVVLVLLSCTGLPILDRLTAGDGPAPVVQIVLALALCLVPLLVMGVLTTLNIRNVALHRYADGRLESVDWTGRRVTVARPDTARVHPIHIRRRGTWTTLDELLVISAAGGGPAIVVLPRWWRPADLDRLTVALAIPIEEMEPETPVEFSHGYPDNRLPSSLRHPLLFPLSVVAAVFAGLIGLIALVSGM
jgi:DNA-binding transcriptional LysR family regulator